MPKILLVDDDFTVKMALEAMLTSRDYEVIGQADSGEEAVEMAGRLKPDLILMDIVMPGDMDGIAAAEKIKRKWDIPIVFLTGHGNGEYIKRAKKMEPSGFVIKPFDEMEIKAVVEIALYKKEIDKKLKASHEELVKLNRNLKTEMEEREKSEEKYRSLFENSPIGIATLDEERNILDFNDAMLHMNGYTRDDLRAFGNTREYYCNPEESEKVTSELLKKGFVKEMEVKLKRKNGSSYDALLSMQPVKIRGKSLWQAMIQDISERKQAENEIRNSRREWEGIFQSTGHPTIILNADHIITHANKATEEATGKPKEHLIGKKCYEIFHNSRTPPESCPYERMIRSGHLETVEMEIDALGGAFLVSCTPMADEEGRIEKVIHIATDITVQKQAQQALRRSEEKYRELVENINDVIYALDTTGTATYISPTIGAIAGYAPSEIIGKQMTEFVHRDDHAALAENFRKLIMEGHIQPHEYRLIDKQGKIRWIKSSSRAIFQDGKLSGIQGVFAEITQSKRLEDQLRQAQKMEAIGTLTGGIAHDYNNLLAIIMGNLSMAQEEAEPHSFIRQLLDRIEEASSKARDLTHQLMTLSAGGYPVKERRSMGALLRQIPMQLQAIEGIEYIYSIQDDLWPVDCDTKQIHYAISNLLANAVEAMPQGGRVILQAENEIIRNQRKDSEIPLYDGKYVRVSIKDEGKGIPEKHLGRIFDPYFSTKERGVQKGMGLGLTTAYAVVQKHGGHILIDSTTGVGTTVSVYLPALIDETCNDPHRPVVLPQSATVDQLPASRRILVMDDEESLRNLAKAMLERLGHEVETAKEGVEAVSKYKKRMESGEPFDLVILDLTIKEGMGGDRTMKELIKFDSGVKGIVCSGYFNDPVMANYREYGFRGALAKPYQKKDLEQLLIKLG